MPKLLVVSNDGVQDGYGRISMEVNTRLAKRGWEILALSHTYDSLLPPMNGTQRLPYHVGSLQGKPHWVDEVIKVAIATRPDVIISIQDFPYAEALRNSLLDWSQFPFVIVTPVDGKPIYRNWINTMQKADAGLTISEFGVQAFREQGCKVHLLRPGIDPNEFYHLPDADRRHLRARLNIPEGAFVLGVMAQNQGRKDIPDMIRGFMNFALDKPDARLLLDMDAVSPMGWDLPATIQMYGWDASKVIWRHDCANAGSLSLRERYNLLDAHAVIAHREGYGIPLVEAQACGVVSIALDYCSGTEICGDGKGVLVKPIEYWAVSTWGSAKDMFPDMDDFWIQLQRLYDSPHERAVIAEKGMNWSRQQTWDKPADVMYTVLQGVMEKRQNQIAVMQAMMQAPPTAAPQSVDGVKPTPITLIETVS